MGGGKKKAAKAKAAIASNPPPPAPPSSEASVATSAPPHPPRPPAPVDVLSAHATIAIFEGCDDDGVAHFTTALYLRYAHVSPTDAEGPRASLELHVATADATTARLADEAEGAISGCIAALRVGDRVELDWLQVRFSDDGDAATETATTSGGVVRHVCQKLAPLDTAAELALVARFPRGPQIFNVTGFDLLLGRCLRDPATAAAVRRARASPAAMAAAREVAFRGRAVLAEYCTRGGAIAAALRGLDEAGVFAGVGEGEGGAAGAAPAGGVVSATAGGFAAGGLGLVRAPPPFACIPCRDQPNAKATVEDVL
jgi:hypothetical protein